MISKLVEDFRFLLFVSFFSLLLSFYQLFSIKVEPLLAQSEVETIEMDQRMKSYPPKYYRLANILEKRPESRIIYKLEYNFFSIFNVDHRCYVFVPMILIGLFHFFKARKYLFLISSLVTPLLILTYIGKNHLGLLSLYPIFFISFLNTYAKFKD